MGITVIYPEAERGTILFQHAVLCDREENGYDDSDGYSCVYDADTNTVRRQGTWTTRCQSSLNAGVVDAYDGPLAEVIRQALVTQVSNILFREQLRDFSDAVREAGTPVVGTLVHVVKGRKVPLGTVGTVERVWVGDFGATRGRVTTTRLLLSTGDWIDAKNVVVDGDDMPDPEDYIDAAGAQEQAASMTLPQLHSVFCAYNSSRGFARA